MYATKDACEAAGGKCSCPGLTTKQTCMDQPTSAGGRCLWEADNQWSSSKTAVVAKHADLGYGKCGSTFSTKAACLGKAGSCSDPSKTTRDECMAGGKCEGGPSSDPNYDFSQWKTESTCEIPGLRMGLGAGKCVVRPGGDPTWDYIQYANKILCEFPSSRPKVPMVLPDCTVSGMLCHCVAGPKGVPFNYAQFKSRETCEIPPTRKAPSVGPVVLKGIFQYLFYLFSVVWLFRSVSSQAICRLQPAVLERRL